MCFAAHLGRQKARIWRGSVSSASIITLVLMLLTSLGSPPAAAQSPSPGVPQERLESLEVKLDNPSPDEALDRRIIDQIRSGLSVFPGEAFDRTQAEVQLARVRRLTMVSGARIEVEPGRTGGVAVLIRATLAPSAAAAEGRGALISGRAADLPVLYDRDGTYLRMRLEGIGMHYGNHNAWYGQPGLLLAGNPLVSGRPAGRGYGGWAEGFVHAGLYGITPLGESRSAYGGVSGIHSASAGRELFTDRTRGFLGVEDAFVGLVGGATLPSGDRLVLNASFGRQRFGIGDGFLIANTASNGGERAALQSNPRWAADRLALVQARWNNLKIEAFHLDPDELPEVDSKTKIVGLNVEARLAGSLTVGATALYAPSSSYKYYTATEVLSREGLQVFDARLRWQPNPAGAGPFLAAEAALQRNSRIDMRAFGWTAELGYSFGDALPWSPTVSYRHASFTGDDPATRRFERWDPLLSGDNGERWVQGVNHFKIFQNSNLATHRFQARLRPLPTIELVPQFWLFTADRTTNLGGNPAFSIIQGRYLGAEANLTAKWFPSPRLMVQGHVAATFPSATVKRTIAGPADPWISTMLFARVGL